MTDDAFMKNGDIRCSAPDINENHTGFFLFFTQHSFCRSYGFQDQIGNFKIGFPDTFVDILCRSRLSHDNMKIGFKRTAYHPFRGLVHQIAVKKELLGNDLDDLFPRGHVQIVHTADKGINLFLADLSVAVRTDRAAMMLKALDMLSGNSHIDKSNIHSRFLGGFFDGIPDRLYRVFNVGNDTSFNPDRRDFAISKDLDLSEFILMSDNDSNLCRADI